MFKHLLNRAVYSAGDGLTWHDVKIPKSGIASIVAVAGFMFMMLFFVDYTLNYVVFTLTVAESPPEAVPNIVEDEPYTDSIDDELKTSLEVKQGPLLLSEIARFSTKPLTCSLRRTLAHLRRVGGFRNGLVRGLPHFLFFIILNIGITSWLPRVLSSIIASMLLALPRAAVTHAIVSAVPKDFRARFPSRAAWKYLLLPAVIESLALQLVVILPVAFALILRIHKFEFPQRERPGSETDSDDRQAHRAFCKAYSSLVIKLVSLSLISLLTAVFVWLPAAIARVHIELSILPAEEATIVPISTASGSSQLHDGSPAPMGFMDAWRRCDCQTIRRILNMTSKIWMVTFSFLFSSVMMVVGVAFIVFQDQLPTIITLAKHQMTNHH